MAFVLVCERLIDIPSSRASRRVHPNCSTLDLTFPLRSRRSPCEADTKVRGTRRSSVRPLHASATSSSGATTGTLSYVTTIVVQGVLAVLERVMPQFWNPILPMGGDAAEEMPRNVARGDSRSAAPDIGHRRCGNRAAEVSAPLATCRLASTSLAGSRRTEARNDQDLLEHGLLKGVEGGWRSQRPRRLVVANTASVIKKLLNCAARKRPPERHWQARRARCGQLRPCG